LRHQTAQRNGIARKPEGKSRGARVVYDASSQGKRVLCEPMRDDHPLLHKKKVRTVQGGVVSFLRRGIDPNLGIAVNLPLSTSPAGENLRGRGATLCRGPA